MIARGFLDDDLTKPLALRIVSTAGDSSDVGRLIELARTTFDNNVRRVALDGAERLSADKVSTARTLIESSARQLRRAGLSIRAQLGDQGTSALFIDFCRTRTKPRGSSPSVGCDVSWILNLSQKS